MKHTWLSFSKQKSPFCGYNQVVSYFSGCHSFERGRWQWIIEWGGGWREASARLEMLGRYFYPRGWFSWISMSAFIGSSSKVVLKWFGFLWVSFIFIPHGYVVQFVFVYAEAKLGWPVIFLPSPSSSKIMPSAIFPMTSWGIPENFTSWKCGSCRGRSFLKGVCMFEWGGGGGCGHYCGDQVGDACSGMSCSLSDKHVAFLRTSSPWLYSCKENSSICLHLYMHHRAGFYRLCFHILQRTVWFA